MVGFAQPVHLRLGVIGSHLERLGERLTKERPVGFVVEHPGVECLVEENRVAGKVVRGPATARDHPGDLLERLRVLV